MAYFSDDKLWESEFDNIVSKKDKVQDMNIILLKLEVHDTYRKDEKITTFFEPTDDSDVINRAYLDDNVSKVDCQLSFLERKNKEFRLQCNKQSVEEFLIQRAVKTTIQILYEEGLLDNFQKTDEVLKNFFFVTRRRCDLEESK